MSSLLIFLSLLASPLSHSVPFSSFLRFIFIQAQYYAVWNLKKKGPQTLFQMKKKKKKRENEEGGKEYDLTLPSYACLHLESILWCK